MDRIAIFDTTLTDGQLAPGASMTVSEKLRMAHQLAALGVDVIEAGSAAPTSLDAESLRRISREVKGATIAASTRPSRTDVARAAQVLETAPTNRIHVRVATSDAYLTRGDGVSRSQLIERVAEAVDFARTLVHEVEFSADDATRTDPDLLFEVLGSAVAAGASIINIPDTAGYSLPAEMGRLVLSALDRVQGLRECVVSTQCYDDLGLAVANSLSAIEAGVRQVHCTVNGSGERAGITPLEEVVMALAVRGSDIGFGTGIVRESLYRTRRLHAYLTGIEPQPDRTGEVVEVQAAQVAGQHYPLEERYEALGYTLSPEELGRVSDDFSALAERKHVVLDEDLISILHHGVFDDAPETYRLSGFEVRCGEEVSRAELIVEGDLHPPKFGVGTGDGPIAAVFDALDGLTDFRVVLKDLTVRSATPGRDALGEVFIHASVDGQTFTGRGADTDVVRASARAYLHAVNKASAARVLEEDHLTARSDVWGV